MHLNELPLRHIFEDLDGATTGPRTSKGVIGQQLETCENLQFIFIKISKIHMPDKENLSTDQQLLYGMYRGIHNGTSSDNSISIENSIANRKSGPIVHSRWLTTAIRILRLYVSTENPSDNLKILSEYEMKVYASCWFDIKRKSSVLTGSHHFFNMISRSRFLKKSVRDIVD